MNKLGIIGYDRMVINKLAKLLLDAVQRKHDWQPLCETDRGCTFEVLLYDPDDKPTSRVARVTVELDRVDPDAKDEAERLRAAAADARKKLSAR